MRGDRILGFIVVLLLLAPMLLAYSSSNPQLSYSGGSSSYLSGQGIQLYQNFDNSQCGKGSDFILQIAPEGCSPTVVRSDLLEEQNVPVFCPIVATKINPTFDIEAIESMSFSGKNPEGVSGVGFHPAQAALSAKESSLINSPVMDNAGYVVVVLNKNENESSMPDFVEGNLTASIRYNVNEVFGAGRSTSYLTEMTTEDWNRKYSRFGFWEGRAYLRAESITEDSARISVYKNKDESLTGATLRKGESSGDIYLPGFYCSASFNLRLDDIVVPETKVQLKIGENYIEAKSGESFLDNRCRIKSISNMGLVKSAELYCTGDDKVSKKFTLNINPTVQIINASGLIKDVELGQKISSVVGDKDTFLVFIDSKGEYSESKDLVLWTATKKYNANVNKLTDSEIDSSLTKIKRLDKEELYKNKIESKSGFNLIYYSESDAVTSGKILNKGFSKAADVSDGGKWEKTFDETKESFLELAEKYASTGQKDGSAMAIAGSMTYSEVGLKEAIVFALKVGRLSDAQELGRKLTELYPTKDNLIYVESVSDEYKLSNRGKSSEVVYVNGNNKMISLENIYDPAFEDYGILLTVKDASGENLIYDERMTKDSSFNFTASGSVVLKKLDVDKAVLQVSVPRSNGRKTTKTITLKEKELVTVEGHSFVISKINLNKEAKVSVIPKMDNMRSEASFEYKIGIDKRAIELSPKKIEDLIEGLNDTLEEWGEISESLGDVVKGLKGACLATGAVLTIKNFFSGLGGGATARQYAMRGMDGKSGIYAYCKNEIAKGTKFTTLQKCLSNDATKKRIEDLTTLNEKILAEQSTELTEIRKASLTGSSWDGQDLVDDSKYLKSYADKVGARIGNETLINSSTAGVNGYSITDLRTLDYCDKMKAKDVAMWELECKSQVSGIMENIQKTSEAQKARVDGKIGKVLPQVIGGKNKVTATYTGDVKAASVNLTKAVGVKGADGYEAIVIGDKKYLVLLKKAKNNKYSIEQAYEYDLVGDKAVAKGENVAKEVTAKVNDFSSTGSFDNKIENCLVEYFGSAPDKGKPAIVPFDFSTKGAGWYVGVRHVLPSLGGKGSNYADSGSVKSYWICNAGADKKIDFNSNSGSFTGGDVCEGFNPSGGTIVSRTAFGMTSSQLGNLAKTAQRAIREAGNYNSNKKTITITGRVCKVNNAAADIVQTQCYDFMSPDECEILFNVCDPVICPSSRCNLGGNYYVNDVIQSGIIGSLALCLPNWKPLGGDVLIPICLSGLKAGIDGLLSVIKSYRSCLVEKLETGKTIGICDEMFSMHLCEFFWRQISPLTDMIVPRLLQAFTGQYVQGGGEYMNIANAWGNAQGSAQYFVGQYAAGSFDILKSGTMSSVGTEICRKFPSASAPDIDLLDSLVSPRSPAQFSGWFSEVPFTDATVPATSQYSVYYHIYAGEEEGAYYKVYLKSPEGTTVYHSNPTVMVDSGYIGKGESADEKKDFTSPSGYKEFCIMVGGQEECGFKQVSTDFALNYVKDKYTQSQSDDVNITKESNCISGSSNAWALLNPNLQSGVTDAVNPEIREQGIVRICSSGNPSGNVDSERWKNVGYCDDESVKCWLDTESVKKAIKRQDIENATLKDISEFSLEALRDKGYMDLAGFNSEKDKLSSSIKSGSIKTLNETVVRINKVLSNDVSNKEKIFFAYQRAALLLIRSQAYEAWTMIERGVKDEAEKETVEKCGDSDACSAPEVCIDDVCVYDEDLELGLCLDVECENGMICSYGVCIDDGVEKCGDSDACSAPEVCIDDVCVYDEDYFFYCTIDEDCLVNGEGYKCGVDNVCYKKEVEVLGLYHISDGYFEEYTSDVSDEISPIFIEEDSRWEEDYDIHVEKIDAESFSFVWEKVGKVADDGYVKVLESSDLRLIKEAKGSFRVKVSYYEGDELLEILSPSMDFSK